MALHRRRPGGRPGRGGDADEPRPARQRGAGQAPRGGRDDPARGLPRRRAGRGRSAACWRSVRRRPLPDLRRAPAPGRWRRDDLRRAGGAGGRDREGVGGGRGRSEVGGRRAGAWGRASTSREGCTTVADRRDSCLASRTSILPASPIRNWRRSLQALARSARRDRRARPSGPHPAVLRSFSETWNAVFREGVLDHSIKELCRVSTCPRPSTASIEGPNVLFGPNSKD